MLGTTPTEFRMKGSMELPRYKVDSSNSRWRGASLWKTRVVKRSRMRHEVSSRWSSHIEACGPHLVWLPPPLPALRSDESAQIKEYASQFAGPKEKFTQIMYEWALYLQFAGSS
jgi:hypothetical protein